MTPERWRQITAVFHAALALGVEERASFVAAQCHDDAALRREIEAMLAAHQEPGPFSQPSSLGAAALEPGARLGPYEVVCLLGAGGMGEVYRARDTKLHRDVALKVLPASVASDPDRLARFASEARTLAALNHPHIAQLHGLEEAPSTGSGQAEIRALVMELVGGPTLADRMARGALPVDEALGIARQISEALEAAHEQGIIHRDLKPANIKVRPDGVVKVLDFGLAKARSARVDQADTTPTPTAAGVTEPGLIVGTAAYMAPEQAKGRSVDRRADIWAFGCVLFEMLSGRRAFDDETLPAVLLKIVDEEPDWQALPSATPASIRLLLGRCLEKDPRRRLDSAAVARLEIDEALMTPGRAVEASSLAIGTSSGATPPKTPLTRRVVMAGSAVATLVLISLGLGAMMRPRAPNDLAPLVFTIAPAQGATWGVLATNPSPAVSPNGRYVAVSARSADGNGVWLHDLESGDARLLARTGSREAAAFWAPDSSSVAFCDGVGVRKLSLDNRPPETVDTPPCSGGSWSAAGDWLLSTSEGFVRMPATGGTPVPVTTIDRTRGELRHAFGEWLTDGHHFVLYVAARTPQVRGIYLGSVDGGPLRRLLEDSSRPAYVGEGDGRGLVLFVRGATLVAQRFDERTLALSSDVVPLGQRVRLGIVYRGASFAASPRLLVYRSGAAYQPTRLIRVDRAGRELGQIGPDTAFRQGVALSPDERTLIYARFNEDTNNLDLWTTDLRRGVSEPFYQPGFSVDSPAWSPDGRRLAYLSAQNGIYVPWILTLGTDNRTPVNDTSSSWPYLDWSADSRSLFRRSNGLVRLFSTDGLAPPVPVLPHDADNIRVSRDGRWVAYSMSNSGRPEVYLERFGGGARVRVSTDGGFGPRWRADDKELFFRAAPDRMMSVSVRLGETAEIGEPRQLFQAAFETDSSATSGNLDYLVTNDGQRFLITIPVLNVKPLVARLNWRSGLPDR